MSLRDLVIHSAQRVSDALAVKGHDASLTYKELDGLANRLAHALAERGVGPGDRVGIWLGKSAYAVAAMQGILRLNAIYVPLDPLSPAARIRTIIGDCAMRALVTVQQRADAVLTDDLQDVASLCIDRDDLAAFPDTPGEWLEVADDDIAYILYTSGSTGKPKGVCISNRNALAFIEWAAEILEASGNDRFASHAPFHFDLSVLDLYVAFQVGASTHLIPDGLSYVPRQLVEFLMRERLTIWYSVPSVLTLMMEQGGLLQLAALPLRAILFAGEPFPIKHLRRLYQRWPTVRFLNLYGPTETNVCTYYEVTHLPDDWHKPVPIGKACSGDTVWAQKADGSIAQPGEEGVLMASGPTVMVGYWGRPAHGDGPYVTGDLVHLLSDGNYIYMGRIDQMVKVRGHRIESGDIEACLEEHPAIHEAAVIVTGSGLETRLLAFIVPVSEEVPTLLEMKRHCAIRLPRYMIVDEVCPIPALPRTRNGKIDRLALATYNDALLVGKGAK
ncbi:MAG TPA: amino acid adenylation domain-containing protein [Ktedonobacteraceae bacterium]|nr:amino acid adenylation domain-containing protein [Ktedonobacteraceae bacterium]